MGKNCKAFKSDTATGAVKFHLQTRLALLFFQVASRVQKYFIKLVKAGLPIPGRLPNRHVARKVQ